MRKNKRKCRKKEKKRNNQKSKKERNKSLIGDFVIFKGYEKCPMCGRECEKVNEEENIKECNACGLIFNEFGIIFSEDSKEDKIIQNN